MAVSAFAADASGTWKWTSQMGRGGGGAPATPRESTLTLVAKDGKLTGKVSTPGRGGDPTVTDITNGTIKGDDISFTVEREFNGNKFVMKYTGKVSGDTITGKVQSPGRDGQSMERDWEARRAK